MTEVDVANHSVMLNKFSWRPVVLGSFYLGHLKKFVM